MDRRRGQALTEFALVAPLLFFILLSIIEFGRASYAVQVLDNAAREGARYAIVHGSNAQCVGGKGPAGPMPNGVSPPACWDPSGATVVAVVRTFAVGVGHSTDLTVAVKWCQTVACPGSYGDGDNGRGSTVRVSVAYTFQPVLASLVPLPSFSLQGDSNLVVNN
jgi:hypothetical protein